MYDTLYYGSFEYKRTADDPALASETPGAWNMLHKGFIVTPDGKVYRESRRVKQKQVSPLERLERR